MLLGTGTPNADPTRSGPAVAIVVNGTPYLIDFGPGVVRRTAEAHLAGIEGLDAPRLQRAFLTHLHSDHTAGYPDLLLTPWVLGRKEPLEVYGPRGLKAMTDHILAAYGQDIDQRIHGLEPANKTGCVAHAHEIKPSEVYRDQNVCVEAFFVNHGSWPAYGYRFHTADRVIVISGDTAPADDLIQAYQGCDVLVHEVYSAEGFARRTPDWQRYHASAHTSTTELAEIASQVKPDLLILYHQLFHGVSGQVLLDEITANYAGKVVSGEDLEVY